MCMCETPGQIIALAVSCILLDVLVALAWLTVMDRYGITIARIVNVAFAAVSALFALFLLFGAASNKKSLIEKFLLGAKLRLFLEVLLVVFSALLDYYFDQPSKRALVDEEIIAENFTTAVPFIGAPMSHLLRALDLRKWTGDQGKTRNMAVVDTLKDSLIISPTFAILVDVIVIWRIGLYVNKMPG
ncbi:uncharacterized protein LOC144107376 [Amblyomma americanum]